MTNLNEQLSSLHIDQSARATSGRRGVWIAVIVVIAALAAGGWFWSQRTQAAEVTTAAVVARGGPGSASGAVLNASGYVTARRRATVSSKVTGKVLEVFVEEGKSVRQGQVLARLDDSQMRSALAVVEAQLEASKQGAAEDEARLREAELTLERRAQLIRDGVIGKAELDSAQAQVDSLKARINMAYRQVAVAETLVHQRRTDLADMVVRAPFDGVAISKDAQPGEMISPMSAGGGFTRTGICTIVDMSSLEIEVDVSESYINRVHSGQPVEAVLDAYPDWRIPAHVITTVPSADRQKATVRVRIGFDPSTLREPQGRPDHSTSSRSSRAASRDEKGRGTTGSGSPRAESRGEKLDARILPDMGVKVSFLAERQAEGAPPPHPTFVVPKTAVRSSEGKDVVFVVHDDRVERRAISLGPAQGDQVEVLSGLNAGERIVVAGPPALADGAKVTVKER